MYRSITFFLIQNNVSELILTQIRETFEEKKSTDYYFSRERKIPFDYERKFRLRTLQWQTVRNRRKSNLCEQRSEIIVLIVANLSIVTLFIQILKCSKLAQNSAYLEKYATTILATALHELGHWMFFKFSCNLDTEKVTPAGTLIKISHSNKILFECFFYFFHFYRNSYGGIRRGIGVLGIWVQSASLRCS